MRQTLFATISLLIMSQAAFPQVYPGFGAPAPDRTDPVLNQPYSGELVADIVKVLPDGSHNTRTLPNPRLLVHRRERLR